MNQHEIEATLEFHRHEMDVGPTDCCRFIAAVEKRLGHDLDGDQDTDGYSIDYCVDFFLDGADVDQAVAEFTELKRAIA